MLDGASLLRSLRENLNEATTSSFMENRTSYEYIYESVLEIVRRTECLRTSQAITTVASQQDYTLNADFLRLYLKDRDNNYYIKYYDATNYYFLKFKDYEDIVYDNNTTAVTIPDKFSITDDATLDTRITGTASAVGASSGGECTLTDTSSATKFADVSAGDAVHNTTDNSKGVVLSKTSNTALVVALFDGTNNDWTSSDAYVIQPQGRFKLVFDPPPSTASHTATVYYVQRPAPVFSDYGIYRIPEVYREPMVEYAAFKYKYRDREPNYGDKFFQYWERKVRQIAHGMNKAFRREGFTVNMKKRQ